MELRKPEKRFRAEIEGLRAVAAILVAIYHIWYGKVSGGVDIFFIVSGFLITTSLLSRVAKHGSIKLFDFLLGLMKRLFPISFLVLITTAIASIIWLPKVGWGQTIKEAFASLFYFQNWQLALNSVDYLAENSDASPFQHFWALSIQGQFYLLWSFIFIILILIAKKWKKLSFEFNLLIILIIVFIFSLSYSIYLTNINQPWAYFDTFTRVWEFSMGGILAILLPYFKVNKWISLFAGWLGLLIIVFTGMLLPVGNSFPGYTALLPTLGAVGVLVASSYGGTLGVHKLLSAKPMMRLGGMSYGIYLWHWPILVFYYILAEQQEVSLLNGTLIILVSVLLSYFSTIWYEKPIRDINHRVQVKKATAILAGIFIIAISIVAYWNYNYKLAQNELEEKFNFVEYPGALSLIDNRESGGENPFIPEPIQAKEDVPVSYEENCHQTGDNSEVIECEFGNTTDYEYEVALVGGSHSAHWLPALELIAETENIKIYNITMSGCRFSTGDEGGLTEPCLEWSENTLEHLKKLKPDLIFTTANVSDNINIPNGFREMWNELKKENIDIMAVRDNPWLGFDGPSCVEENLNNPEKCSVERENVLPGKVKWEEVKDDHPNVKYVDYSDAFCTHNQCPAVVGNILIYRDTHHITTKYSKTLAPVIKQDLMDALIKS